MKRDDQDKQGPKGQKHATEAPDQAHDHPDEQSRRDCGLCGSEVARDRERADRGPTYHGGDWDRAEQERARPRGDENIDDDGDVSGGKGDREEADAEIDPGTRGTTMSDPGTRGAVRGRGGEGLTQPEPEIENYRDGRWERDPDGIGGRGGR